VSRIVYSFERVEGRSPFNLVRDGFSGSSCRLPSRFTKFCSLTVLFAEQLAPKYFAGVGCYQFHLFFARTSTSRELCSLPYAAACRRYRITRRTKQTARRWNARKIYLKRAR
jgi:hypothetical protein